MAASKKTVKTAPSGLFDDAEPSLSGHAQAVVRVGGIEATEMSAAQRKFNAFARKIEELRLEIEGATLKYDEILAHWSAKLAPFGAKVSAAIESIAFALEEKANSFKLGVRQRKTVGELIIELLDNAFSIAPPEQAARELFDRWNERSFTEELEAQEAEKLEAFGEAVKEAFGLDLDEEILRSGPEAVSQAIREAHRGRAGGSSDGGGPGAAEGGEGARRRKPTKKRLEREERERATRELERKTLRSLYLSLVKALHPDAERDPAARSGKEEVMKELTSAYEGGDFHSLLRIEMAWLARESSHLASLDEKKLEVYLAALKDQARELRLELDSLRNSPRYEPIAELLEAGPALAKMRIDAAAKDERRRLKALESIRLSFKGRLEKHEFLEAVRIQLGG